MVEVIVSVYDTKMKSIVGTRLDKVKVLKHVEYQAPNDDIQSVAPPTESPALEEDAVMF